MFLKFYKQIRFLAARRRFGGLLAGQAPAAAVAEAVEKVAGLAEDLYGEISPQTADWLQLLGSCYRETGNPEAKVCLERALTISRQVFGPYDPRVAVVLSNLGGIYRIFGQVDDAESCYREALAIDRLNYKPDHEEVLTDLSNLALLRFQRDDPARNDLAEARKDLDYIRQVELARYGPLHPNVAGNHLNWAGVLIKIEDDWQGAEREVRRALEISERACPHQTIKIAHILTDLSGYIAAQGQDRLGEALEYAEQALEILKRELGETHPDCSEVLYLIGLLQAKMGNPEKALHLLHQGALLTDGIIWKVFTNASERQRLTYLLGANGAFDLFLSLVLTDLPDSSEAVSQAFDLVLRRKGIVLESTTRQQELAFSTVYPQLSEKLMELHRLRRQAAATLLSGPGVAGKEVYQASVRKCEADRDRLEAELAREIPEMNLERRVREADQRAVAATLPSGAVMIEYVRFNLFDFKAQKSQPRWAAARYLAFILKARQPMAVDMVDLGEAARIDQAISAFRRQIEQEGRSLRDLLITAPGEDEPHAGVTLCSLIFDPLRPSLGASRRLFCAPDGELNLVPLETLPVASDRYLIEDFTVSYLNTGREMLRFGPSPTSVQPPLILADPDFDLASKEGGDNQIKMEYGREANAMGKFFFSPIPGTRREGQAVAPLATSLTGQVSRVWLDREVLKGRLKKERSPFILHIATHGFFLRDQDWLALREKTMGPAANPGERSTVPSAGMENPLLRSGLALAGANLGEAACHLLPESEDGILTAEDVTCLNLQGTELVVLSACDTGLGEVLRGEGVMGLRRAFIQAGVRTLVMSLWRVPDEETAELMGEFYQCLSSGLGRAEALREAQLARLARSRLEKGAGLPHSWGAFIILGAVGVLPRPLANYDRNRQASGTSKEARKFRPLLKWLSLPILEAERPHLEGLAWRRVGNNPTAIPTLREAQELWHPKELTP
jgi:CHAT domain-containing protein